ncbi:MAG TPA: hypothetical protein VFZ64_08035 [Nocardioidaceae bacterium]
MDAEEEQDRTEDSHWRRRSVPDNEAPVSVAFDAILARNEDAAVFLSGLRVYRNGVRFTVEARTRTRLFESGDLHSALHDHGPTAVLLGIELADGRRCTHHRREPPDPTGPALLAQGGGGSSRSADLTMFLSPLPPSGTTKLVCAWPWLGIGDQVTLLPTDTIVAAAGDVVELWPWEPEIWRREPAPAAPDVPHDSWFSPARRQSPRR